MIHIILAIWHWIFVAVGGSNASGGQYLIWSGVVGDLGIFAAIITWYFHSRCHVETCHKRGKYPFQHYKLCYIHHPDVPDKITHLHIKKLHKEVT